MKNFTFISAILLSLQFVNAQAAVSYKCLDFKGNILPSIVGGNPGVDLGLYYNIDPVACAIVRAPEVTNKHFPDITFLYPNCFSGKFIGDLGGNPVIVTTTSAITENYNTTNGFNYSNSLPDMTAATAITINKLDIDGITAGRYIGTVYTLDVSNDTPEISNELNPREYLTVVGGSQLFTLAKGRLVIEGDSMSGADVKGKLCY